MDAQRADGAGGSLTGALSDRRALDPDAGSRAAGAQGRDRHPRRAREQPEEHRRQDPARRADRGDRRQRLGQVDAGQRHPLQVAGEDALQGRRRCRRARPDRGHRADRQGDRDRSVADRRGRRDRTRRPTPACSPSSATCSRWMPEAKARGFKPGRFSFNVKGGRCEACQGDGVIAIEMHFLPDVYVTCEQCKGRRYNRETLEIKYRGKSIADVLELTVDQALPLLENLPAIANKLRTLQRRRPRLRRARAVGDDAVGRRGAAGEARQGAVEARHRPHALHPRRADDRPALRGHAQAARRADQARRSGQHDRGDRAQPRRDQVGGLRDRSRARRAAPAAGGSSRRGRRKRWRGARRRRPDASSPTSSCTSRDDQFSRWPDDRCGKIATTSADDSCGASCHKIGIANLSLHVTRQSLTCCPIMKSARRQTSLSNGHRLC